MTHSRYGGGKCDGDRLPVDNGRRRSSISCLQWSTKSRSSGRRSRKRLPSSKRPDKRQADLARLEAQLRKTSEALERYFRAFEEETLPAAACGSRIGQLSEKLRGL